MMYLNVGYVVFLIAAVIVTWVLTQRPQGAFIVVLPFVAIIQTLKGRMRISYGILIDDVKNAAKRSSALADEKLYLFRLLQDNFLKAVGTAKYLAVWPWQRSTHNSVDFISRSMGNIIEHLEDIEWFEVLRRKVKNGTATEEELEDYHKRKQEVNFALQRINGEIAELPDLGEQLTTWKGFPLTAFADLLWIALVGGFILACFN
jgi:hypothetical protein